MNFALVLEYCPRGSLYQLLVKKKLKLPLLTIVGMARDAAQGILHLHKVNYSYHKHNTTKKLCLFEFNCTLNNHLVDNR